MTYPRTVFDRPQAELLPDSLGERLYGNVSNALELVTRNGRVAFIPVAVPSMIFTYMKQVMKVDPSTMAHLAIDYQEPDDDTGDGWYTLSIVAGDNLHDLWAYTPASLPAFLLRKEFQTVPR